MDETTWDAIGPAQGAAFIEDCVAYNRMLRDSGRPLGVERLQRVCTATTLRWEGGVVSVTDCPYAGTKEQPGGARVLVAKGLNGVIQLVPLHPGARPGDCFEVRPAEPSWVGRERLTGFRQAGRIQCRNVSTAAAPNRLNDGECKMKYMLLVYCDEKVWKGTEHRECCDESVKLTHELKANGQYLAASPLQSVATATSVQVREGKRFVTDGPFAETREQLGGYFLVEAKDLDDAISIAGRIPGARRGTIEIRPVMELAGLPEARL